MGNIMTKQLSKNGNRRSSVLVKLFKGDIPLWQTFWLFGVAFSLIYRFLAVAIISNQHVIAGNGFAFFIMLFGCLGIAYQIFIWIAIWNSASKYRGNTLWAILAKVAVAVSILFALFEMFALSH